MSACGAADRTARWTLSERPRWTIRRTTAILAASLLLVAVAGVPAWAGASIAPTEVEANTDTALTLTVTEPTEEESEAYGDTARVVVRAPSGFSDMVCAEDQPFGWTCAEAEDGTRITYTRTSLVALADSRDFGLSIRTSPFNGQHAFRVTQADGPPAEEGEEPPATVSSAPAVTVIGGQAPPTEDGSQGDGGSDDKSGSDGGGSQDGGGTDDDATQSDSDPETTTEGASSSGDDDQETATDDSDTDDSGSAGGSTTPRRTQGRSSGTTLEIAPGEPTDDDPAIAPPAVADDPAVAPPSGTDSDRDDSAESTAAAAAGAQPSDQPDGGVPWQQWVGAAMLLAGLATVGVRWFRERRSG